MTYQIFFLKKIENFVLFVTFDLLSHYSKIMHII